MSRRASTATKSAATARLRTSPEPKSTDGRQVEQEPGGDLAVLVVLAHVGRLQARGDVPVDVAHVVVVLVLAQVGEVEAEAAEQRAVVAVQQAVETADHRPLEPAQDRFRISPAAAATRTCVSQRLLRRGNVLHDALDDLVGATSPSASAS